MTDQWTPLPSRSEFQGMRARDKQTQSLGFLFVKPKRKAQDFQQSSAAQTDHLALLVTCFICLTGLVLACRIQLAYSPPVWLHLFIVLPLVLLGLGFRLLNGGLGSSRSR